MNTTERLAFRLLIAEPNTDERTITVCPRYDGLKLKWSRPSGQMYYTEDISGTLKFLGVDFQTLNACALNTQFTLIVYQNRVEVGRSLFRKTDCKWDIDHGVVDVDVSVYDKYKKFQDKKDEEYNLVKMGLEKQNMNFYVYPARQVYALNDVRVEQFMFNEYFSLLDVGQRVDINNLVEEGFMPTPLIEGTNNSPVNFKISPIIKIPDDWTVYPGLAGGYFYSNDDGWLAWSQQSNISTYSKRLYKNGVWSGTDYINFQCILETVGGYNTQARLFRIDIYGNGLVTPRYSSTGNYVVSGNTFVCQGDPISSFGGLSRKTKIKVYDRTGSTIDLSHYYELDMRCCVPVVRVLTPLTIDGNNLYKDEDITANSIQNYKSYVRDDSLASGLNVKVSNRTSPTDTGYGLVENTSLYYDTPDDTHNWVKIYQDAWFDGLSFWIENFHYDDAVKNAYRGASSVADFYLFTDAIRAVAQKIDEDIQFDSLDSQFLFNSLNPLNGIQQGALYISQKSNILNLGYDYPAWLAPVKWSQIETLLREAFDCYWSLYDRDGHKHLRIEHRRWYELGGTYTQSAVQVASIDLTATFRNGTSFTFGEKTRHWEFDTDGNGTVSTASRHEYGWMDTQSEIFDGQVITVPEEYRLFTDEKTEQHKIDWFSSDIDFLTSVQAECSSDGFAIVMENPNQPNWIVTGAAEYSGQNYQLSFDYLQDKYLLQGIYAEYIKIGDNATLMATNSNARMRTSEIQLRVPAGMSIEASDTINTKVGIGVIDTLEYDLHSQLYTVKLRYENE